jgi:ribosomal protein S17
MHHLTASSCWRGRAFTPLTSATNWQTIKVPLKEKSMKKNELYIACAFLAAALCAPALSIAQSPFDGTWITNINATQFSPKPSVFYLSQGWYHCVSCTPAIDAKADGTDQAVTGQAYDTLSVKEIDAKSLAFTAKKGGTVSFEQTRTVSADGKTLTVKTTNHPPGGGDAVIATTTATLVGIAPAGVHKTSGSWKTIKVQESENGLASTYKTNGDELTMSDPTGVTFTAKMDGTDAPVKGSYGRDTVSVKKIDAHTIEETDKRGDTVVGVSKVTISADGKKMTRVYTAKPSERVTTYTATKK